MALKDRLWGVVLPIGWKLNQKAQKYMYSSSTKRYAGDELVFLNTGYEEEPPMAIPLEPADEPERYSIQLYHRVAAQVNLAGKRVLEVGAGHGGGASYLTRTLHPESYTGLDLNPAGIAFCQKKYDVPGLDFVQGDAQNLPFADESFDAVINIESSLYYPDFSRFLGEVARVLRPGGHFLYTDFRLPFNIAAWETALANAPMRIVSQTEINDEILRGYEKLAPSWKALHDRHTPRLLRGAYVKLFALDGKTTHPLKIWGFSYRVYCLAKG
ncbi:fatty-acid O-methyltransferase Mtf2 [Mycobacterium ostraviense]|uniref:SAM-dependent methyltransferase n=1 Tax=Mycobacterium ostraviense TaxID=2738409 RepID=A0A163SYC7_9MYCO|nr:class I SAM-dependent methyltransferase [Mycobacterium ostraviense]KZS54737.1 SAM-dependent methyltransferase [Mycobacterium ostraviense]